MKNIKDITISIFAIIGFISIITAFNTQPQKVTNGNPESHVWEMHVVDGGDYSGRAFAINKVTGEVRKYHRKIKGGDTSKYIVMKESVK